ncbi:MAG: PDDEXK nuclease domain-containing protein [Thermoplasmata archaeon]|nr:PDDEXK nuclease domain-containing protein [Thermoplasmata archaeon]
MKNEEKLAMPDQYPELLREVKSCIRSSRSRAMLAANKELVQMYGEIGRLIVERQRDKGWGSSIVERLASDIQSEFPGIKGFSQQNIWHMRSFYLAWAGGTENLPQVVGESVPEYLPQVVGEIPWGHNLLLLSKLKKSSERIWYAHKTVENGWSRAVLTAQIESNLYGREGQAITNFEKTLPSPQSDLARQTLKDPYIFDFLTLPERAVERDLENALIDNITQFLLELGVGFAFLGRQRQIEVEGEDFYIDLLFYHIPLRSYVVIDLKMEKFKPEHAGKMNFYLAAIDAQLRGKGDAPSIGIILCKEKKRMIVEYALSATNRPVGVAEWTLTHKLPEHLRSELPNPREIEDAMRRKIEEAAD